MDANAIILDNFLQVIYARYGLVADMLKAKIHLRLSIEVLHNNQGHCCK